MGGTFGDRAANGHASAQSVYLSKNDMVTAVLRELIMNREFGPGDALRQRDLAQRFQVSPTPVREALRRLEVEGLVRYDTHRGSRVVEVDYGATRENFRIRASLESLAAELAAERISPEHLRELQRIHTQLCKLDHDDDQIHEVNRQFHFRIYDAAQSPLLLSMVRRLWQPFPHGPQVIRSAEESSAQHEQILHALQDRDAARAAQLTREHILGVIGLTP